MPLKKYPYIFYAFFLCIIFIQSFSAQTYCDPTTTINNNNNFIISNVSLSEINNTTNNEALKYEYYNTPLANLNIQNTYTASLSFAMSNNNEATVKVWMDYNDDGDFNDTGEEIYSFTGRESRSMEGITKTFQVVIPTSAIVAETRMRVAIKRGDTIDTCDLENKVGEVEDYAINIKPIPFPPTAVCISSIAISLDVAGNASISAVDIDNGSFDDYDDPEDLIITIDRSSFNCDDIENPVTVNLTVTDSDGLTSTCSSTVNVSAYEGIFTAPILEDITEFCSYTVETPVMNFLCTQQIVGTTSDSTTFNSPGNYTIDWSFNDGTTTVTSTQNITIINPTTPTNINVTNINETSAQVNWTSNTTAPFRVRYRLNGTTDWTEITTSNTYLVISGLDDGFVYDYQVKVDVDCSDYSAINTFTTVEVEYCDDNVQINKSNKFFISNVNIGNINNSSGKNDNVYTYYNTLSTPLVVGETFSGSITYSRLTFNVTALVVWIDFNNDGDFFDAGEEIISDVKSDTDNSVFTIELNNILVPEDAVLGKTRLRVGLKHTGIPTSACNFDDENGDIEDYDVYLNAPDNSLFEAALITQVYHLGADERWIEITNTSTTDIIPANTIYIALFKNKTGDQTGVTPDATFLVNEAIGIGESVLIRNPSSIITAFSGLVIGNSALTDFDGENDIIAITKRTNNTAWENRFDTVSDIPNNTSIVRSDAVTVYNSTFTASNWISFIDDSLSTITNPPERHPHDPLISEIENADVEANIRLGVHKWNSTSIIGNIWTNGSPDRSRSVFINENFNTSSMFSARQLEIANESKLVIHNQLLVVTDNITINTTGEIRLVGTSQLIQTHTGNKNISGNGKLYVDQNSTVPSTYRYNYMSSPVSTPGLSTHTLLNVMKDGTTPTSLNSVPKNINFIGGLDGNFNNSPNGPIEIADYWIYTYDDNGSSYNYISKSSSGIINPGKGYLFKGPGRPQNYTYVGSPNDGTYAYSIPGNSSILLGNPYPSALNSKKFLEDNLESTTATLYFWEHAGESNSSSNLGHYASGYIGGYATRNIAMGVSASSVNTNSNSDTTFDFTIEAENAVKTENISIADNGVMFSQPNETLTFNNINISKSVDVFKIVYKSPENQNFDISVNGEFIKTVTLTTSASYTTAEIPLDVNTGDVLWLKSTTNIATNIDKIFFTLTFEYTAPEKYIPIAQGFFVSSDSDGGNIVFHNSQREFVTEGDNSVFLKSRKNRKISKNTINTESLPILKLKLEYFNNSNQLFYRQIGISFDSKNTFNFDKGFDSDLFDLNETDFYWQFDSEPNRKLSIAGVQEINYDLEIPLTIVVETSKELLLSLDQLKNIQVPIYLLDKLTNTKQQLSNSKISLALEKGEYKNRFFITFGEKTLATENIENDFAKIYIDNKTREFVINQSEPKTLEKITLYNIIGQEVQTWTKFQNTTQERFQINELPTNIYIVKVKSSLGTMTKKIILK